MKNREKVGYVFTSSNTRRGFHSFIPELISGLRQVFVLKGAAGAGKATFMRLLGQDMLERGFRVEFWVSAFDPLNPEGVLIPEIETAVVGASWPEAFAYEYKAAVQVIDLDIYGDPVALAAKSDAIGRLHEQMAAGRRLAGRLLETAGITADGIKKINARHINREKMAALTDDLAERIINQPRQEKHYFASAVTAEGMINYIDTISQSCRQRYIFTGPAGSGKSAVIAAIAERAKAKGFSLQYYHNGLDADSLSAVIIGDLQAALIDAGYLTMNLQPGDEIIEAGQYLDNYDRKQNEELTMPAKRQYEALMQEAQQQLEKAQFNLRELKRVYAGAIDLAQLDQRRQEIIAAVVNPADKDER